MSREIADFLAALKANGRSIVRVKYIADSDSRSYGQYVIGTPEEIDLVYPSTEFTCTRFEDTGLPFPFTGISPDMIHSAQERKARQAAIAQAVASLNLPMPPVQAPQPQSKQKKKK